MTDVLKNPAGEVIQFRSRKMGARVQRPSYTSKGITSWSARFYFSKMVDGSLVRFPLSPVPAEAEKLADQIAGFFTDPAASIQEAKRKFNPLTLLRSSNFSTIGDIIDYHTDHWRVLDLAEGVARGYQRSLVLILRTVDAWRKGEELVSWSGRRTGMDELLKPWYARPTSELTARLAMDYQRLMVPSDLEDEEEEITQKITCDTALRNARAMFSKEAMKVYKASVTIRLPDITDFMGVSLFNAKKYFVLPDPAVIRRIFAAAPQLKSDDLNAYRAFHLCAQGGLRKTEAANVRMEWLQEGETPVLRIHTDGTFKPKHGHGRQVMLDEWVAEEMRAIAAPGKYFMDGNEGERTDHAFDRLNRWLRLQGITSGKPTHELRKLWFSQKVKRTSLLEAAQQGGHRDVKITQSFYADSQMPDNVLPFWISPAAVKIA